MSPAKLNVNEGIQLALLPLAGYWLCFLYQVGYNGYFDIPLGLISLGLSEALSAAAALLLVFVFGTMFADIVRWAFVNWFPSRYRSKILIFIFWCVLFTSFALGARTTWMEALWKFGPALLLVTLSLFTPKTETPKRGDGALTPSLDILFRRVSDPMKMLVVGAYILSVITIAVGGLNARFTQNFIILDGNSTLVVLKQLDGYFVAAKFDRQSRKVSPEYQLVPFSENTHTFKYEKLGQLEPVGLKRKQ